MIHTCAWSESKNNKLSIGVDYKTFSHVTGCLYFNVIYRPSVCPSTLEYILVHFECYIGHKIFSDKAKITIIKNVKKEKAVFYDAMICFDK